MTENLSSPTIHRPFAVTLLALVVLSLTVWNGLRLGEAISSWQVLSEYGAKPLYITASGGFWLLSGLPLFWGLWRGKAWARIAVLSAAALYTSWYWFDRLALQPVPHSNWPFALSVNILILVFTASALFNRQSTYFFKQREAHDRQS
jgi:hypothetical protein